MKHRPAEEICLVARTAKLIKDDYQALLKSLGIEHVVLDKSKEGTGGGVRLATMHRVKGLEFPVMILAGVNSKVDAAAGRRRRGRPDRQGRTRGAGAVLAVRGGDQGQGPVDRDLVGNAESIPCAVTNEMSHDTTKEENESMRDEKSPDVFSVHPMKVLVQAYQRRLQQVDPTQNDTITIERSLFDDLIRVADSCQKLQMADEPLRKRRIVIEGEKNTFCCKIEYLTDDGGSWL